jgi:23S rRNA pseudouridine1911/1915/1917 synthase
VLNVIHEDADLLVVQKPAGLVCHPTKDGEMSSLVGRARLYLNTRGSQREPAPISLQPSVFGPRPFLVNRLDRETGGVVLIAKNSQIAGELGKMFEGRAVVKEYLAIVHGHVAAEQGTIDAPLGRDEHSRVAIKDCVRPDGAPAQTDFFVERRFVAAVGGASVPASRLDSPSSFSLLRLVPRTGRKHQLRIHLAHLGHPIVGDKIYGGDEECYLAFVERRLTESQRARLIFANHALHARSVKLVWRGLPLEFSCPPEPWFTAFAPADFADSRG